jgi:hypothetical protein
VRLEDLAKGRRRRRQDTVAERQDPDPARDCRAGEGANAQSSIVGSDNGAIWGDLLGFDVARLKGRGAI